MKRTLLIMPRVPYAINDWNLPPVGVLYVSSSMKENKLPVVNLNLNLDDGNLYDIIENAILKNDIDIVAVGGLVVNYNAVKEVVDIAKQINPKITTIIGGGLVTHSPVEAMQIIENADYGVIGEGEITNVELTIALSKGIEIDKVSGIIYRDQNNGSLNITEKRVEIEDLDSLPWPDYEGFDYFDIVKKFSSSNKITAPVTTSRACPYKCTFCSKSGGEKYRKRSIVSIMEEIDFLIEKYNITEVFLNDELFADHISRVSEFCEEIKKRNISWHIMLRISKNITKDLLYKMKESGCLGICYGMESADNNVLKSMKKGITIQDIYRVVKLTNQENLTIRGGFIFGDTVETLETANKTLKWIKSNIDILGNISMSPIILYPGSYLYSKAVLEGKIQNKVKFIEDGCKPINISSMTDKEYYEFVNSILPKFSAMIRYQKSLDKQRELKEKIIKNETKNYYEHSFKCDNCSNIVKHRLYPTSLFQSHVVCGNCFKGYDFTPSFLYFKTFEIEITNELRKSKIAIWGAGETLVNLYQCNEYLRNSNIDIIDLDEQKQISGFFGKKVYDLERINSGDIKTVLCCVGNAAYFSIKETIFKKFADDINVLWINDIGLRGELYEVEK